ncbi:MAG: hypothetical protein HFJ45_08000 [Clostridia bacterium]|nr:hypothetical protein [Clostridia bacterium]
MRKRGYVLSDDFPLQIKSVMEDVLNNNYSKEISKAISKANEVLENAKTAEKFKHDQEMFEKRKNLDESELEERI